jgi:hypothetical protein
MGAGEHSRTDDSGCLPGKFDVCAAARTTGAFWAACFAGLLCSSLLEMQRSCGGVVGSGVVGQLDPCRAKPLNCYR